MKEVDERSPSESYHVLPRDVIDEDFSYAASRPTRSDDNGKSVDRGTVDSAGVKKPVLAKGPREQKLKRQLKRQLQGNIRRQFKRQSKRGIKVDDSSLPLPPGQSKYEINPVHNYSCPLISNWYRLFGRAY